MVGAATVVADAATPAPKGRRKTPAKGAATAAAAAAPVPYQATLDEIEAAELATAAQAIQTDRAGDARAAGDRGAGVRSARCAAPQADTISTRPDPAPVTAAVVAPRPSARADGGGRNRTPIAAALGIIALVLLVGGVGAYLLLPSATIVVTPKEESLGPVAMTIEADLSASAPDATSDPPVVPAETVTVDVATSGTFPATGKRVEKEKATGTVRFRNKDFTSSNTIPAGSVISTANGVKFKTNSAVTVPRADIVGLQVFPKSASVKVTAVTAGPDGNVQPNTIVVIPRGEDPISLDVNNPDETKGGKRDEFPKVTQEDVDAAMLALDGQLDAAFLDQLADPTIASPDATVFPETRALGPSTPTVDPATLVDQELETFDLELTATGTATAVNADPVRAVAEERLRSSVDPNHQLLEGSVEVNVDPAVVTGGRISFPVSASATQTAILDASDLKQQVMGRSLDEARSILEAYGAVELTPWPDWVSTVPTFDGRVDLTIQDAVSIESPTPEPTS